MSTQQHKIEIDAYLKTHLNDLDKTMGQLRKGLEEGATKVDLTKGLGKDLSKLITKFQAESSKLKGLIPDNMLNLSDSKNFQAAGASIISTFKQIQQTISDINTKNVVDVKKMFPDAFDSRVDWLSKRLESFATRAADIGKRSSELTKAQERLTNLENELSRINEMKPMDELKKEVDRTTDSLSKAAEAAKNLREQLANQLSQSPIDEKQFEEAEKQVTDLSKSIDNLKNRAKKIDAGGITKKGSSYAIGGKNIKEWEQEKKGGNAQAKEAIEVLQLYRKQNKELEIQQQLLARGTLLKSAQQKKPEEWTKQEAEAVAAAFQKTEQLAEANKNAETAAKAATEAQKNLNKAAQAGDKKAKIEIDISDTKKKIEELKTSISNLRSAGDLSGLKETFKTLGIEFAPQMLENAEGIQTLQKELNKIDATAFDALKVKLKELGGQFPEIAQALKQFENGMGGARVEADKMFDALKEVESLKSRITYFLGLTNTINLFKNTVRSAMETVKELDAVMTETAVVTDFTIGDMWDKLPEYSSKATQLGASIKDLYSATTLYYQQGLKTEAAMGVGIETMKMARIANLEAGDATQYMTAALRGFNMEVNETNAIHVNDVYSELAAITAADTSQIATAMSKTASIANAANMEFETTAALLAQIIETTQEAPETAGTAMKTIIARFTEVKELFTEGMLSGEDEEGEIIDINKIDAALRTVGISLRDFLNGNKGIDDIFLELAEKWDTLDLATQRYIATAAAGSRQQSRFIAMMSNYGRTMELVSAANNSAGASQEQFGKTLESLEAKTQKLQNAWAEFTMGLANNEVLKFGVDILTGLLTVINKVTEFLSGKNGIAKSLLTLTLAITALKGAKTIIGKVFASDLLKATVGSFNKIQTQANKTGQHIYNAIKNNGVAGLEAITNAAPAQGFEAGLQYEKSFNMGRQAAGASKVVRVKAVRASTGGEAGTPPPVEEPSTSEGKWYNSSYGYMGAGIALAGAGTGINSWANSRKAKDDMDVLGNGLEGLGNSASIAGSAISLLGPILAKLGVSLGYVGLAIGVVCVAAGLLAAAFQAIYNASPAGQLEKAEKAAECAGEAANNAAESFDNLNTALDSLDNKYKSLEELTRGTKEWNAAVRETNQEVLDLIEKYPALAAFVESSNGVLTFNKDPNKTNAQGKNFNEIYAGYEAAVGNSQIVKIKADAEVEAARQIADADQKMRDLGLDNDTDFGRGYVWITSESGAEDRWSYDAEEIFNDVARAASIGADNGGLDIKYGEGAENTEAIQNYLQSYFKENQEELGLTGFDEQQVEQAAITLGNQLTKASDELATWGNILVSSDEKIKAYNDTLIAQARNSSGIYDKELGNMAENFVTDEMFARFEEKSKKDPTKLSEQDYGDYALNVLGGYYKDKKFYNAAGEVQEDITDEQVAQGLATVKATKMATKAMLEFADKINNIKVSKDDKDFGIKNLYTKAQGQGLTLQDFQNFGLEKDGQINTNKDEIKTVAEKLYNSSTELQNSYGSIDEFVDYFINEVGLGAEYYNQTMEKLKQSWWGKGQEGIFSNQSQLDTGSMGAIVDQLYNVFLTSGKSASDNLGGYLQEAFNKIEDPEQAQLFANALNTIDWKNIDSVEKLNEYLIDFGFDATAAGIDVEDLEEKIKDFAKATKNINLESLKAEIKSLDELAEDLADREETERVFSDEEKKALLKANPDMANDFVMTGIDEWTYVGDSMGTLEEAVREATKTLWETYSEQTREAGEKSQKWEDLARSGTGDYALLQNIAQNGTSAITNPKDLTEVVKAMVAAGIIKGSESEIYQNYDAAYLADMIKLAYDQYGAVAVRTENIANAQNVQNGQYATAYYSDLSGQEILNAESTYGGIEKDEDIQARKDALNAKLVTEEGLREEEMALREANTQLREHNDLTSAAISDAADHRKEMQKLADVINDNEDALSNAAKGTAEYQKAIDKVTVVAKEAFGDNITSDFVESNLDAFKDWAKGVEGSTERIRAALQKEAIASLELTEYQTQRVISFVNELNNSEFDIYGNADFSQIFTQLAALMGSAEEAEKFVESLGGYSLDWKVVGYKNGIRLPIYKAIVSNTGERARQTNAVNNSGGSGGGSDVEYYDNTFDKLYNLVREIGEEVREMARLERKYEKLLKSEDTDAGSLYDNLVDQLNQLGRQQGLNERLRDERRVQIQDYLTENSELNKYANIFQNEDGRDVLRINWEQIDAILDPDRGQQVEDYVGQLEEWMDELDDIEEELWDIEDQIEEIHETGKQEYLDLEVALKEAVEWSYQEEIDKLSQINDSINDTNTKLINSIQKQINKIRQDRENEKREQELEEKQRQLMYLNQDTSGANAIQVLGLQEEIDSETQDYTDSLIDQKISELQEQNEDAAAQREKQIQLLQTQLDYAIKTGEIWNEVYTLIDDGLDPTKGLVRGSALENLLKRKEGFEGMSQLQQMEWLEELEDQAALAAVYLNDLKNVKPSYSNITNNYYQGSQISPEDPPQEENNTNNNTGSKWKASYEGEYWFDDYSITSSSESGALQSAKNYLKLTLNNLRKQYEGTGNENDIAAEYNRILKAITVVKAYKKGGLADFTGPAWLDGTKSRPEMVLNARDTQNFIQLKDILSSLLNRTSSTNNASTENNGDITYDIDINVETMSSDYDVEQVANKVKSLINEDARYRNNNAVSLTR